MTTEEHESIALVVGERYPLPLPPKQGGVTEFLRPSGNTLLLHFPDIQPFEAKAFRKGDIYAGLLVDRDNINFIWQFCKPKSKQIIMSMDGHFDARLLEDPVIPEPNPDEHLAFSIHVVDSTTKIIKALRYITLPRFLSQKFLAAVKVQLDGSPGKPTQPSADRWLQMEPQELATFTPMYKLGQIEED